MPCQPYGLHPGQLERPIEKSVKIREPAGRLILDASVLLPQLTVRGAALKRKAVLRWEGNGCLIVSTPNRKTTYDTQH